MPLSYDSASLVVRHTCLVLTHSLPTYAIDSWAWTRRMSKKAVLVWTWTFPHRHMSLEIWFAADGDDVFEGWGNLWDWSLPSERESAILRVGLEDGHLLLVASWVFCLLLSTILEVPSATINQATSATVPSPPWWTISSETAIPNKSAPPQHTQVLLWGVWSQQWGK